MKKTPDTLARLHAELGEAMAAKKCWRCGCFQDTVTALQDSSVIHRHLAALLQEASSLFEPKRYDCLGCDVCWPAVAQNLAAELDPVVAEGGHCATQAPEQREGWPPLPGDYQVVRMQAPVAVCTLNSDYLVAELAASGVEGLSLVGTLHTENLGIEHLIRNTLANPNIRFLVLCGEDTQKAIGHLPGQSLVSLFQHGVNEKMCIIEAKGKRPLLKNLDVEHVEAFRQQVKHIECIGETDIAALLNVISQAAANNPGPFAGAPKDILPIPIESVAAPVKLTLDPAGYFVVYPDRSANQLVLEHYTNKGVLGRMLTAQSPAALYAAVIGEKLISRLDHAAYLGRELARAEQALKTGEPYVQDRAPGQLEETDASESSTHCKCIIKEEKLGMKTRADHWNEIFHQTDENKLGWHEHDYIQTLKFLDRIPGWGNSKVFVPGVGTSGLIDVLLAAGAKLVLNDISSEAIEIAKARYTDKTHNIRWLCQDISKALPEELGDIDIWIDRAVLHFLVDEASVEAYFRNVHAVVKPGGYALFAEFSKTGAAKCAGLDVRRYSLEELKNQLPEFEVVASDEYTYINPHGDPRPYIYALFKRQYS